MLERREPVGDGGDAAAHVGDGERGPVREVAHGGRPVRGEVTQGELGQRRVAVEAARRRHAIGEQRVGVLAVARDAAAHDAEHLEASEQQHELLARELVAPVGQGGGEVRAGAVGCRLEQRLDGAAQRLHAVAQRPELLLEDRQHARRGDLLQPLRVIGVHVVPGRAQHVEAQHATVGERQGQVALARRGGARRDRPRGLRRVLGLHGEQRPHDPLGVAGRSSEQLRAQPPTGEVAVGDHPASVGRAAPCGERRNARLASMENSPVDHVAAAELWDAYRAARPELATDPEPPSVEQFGDHPALTDELLDLVIAGTKRATAGLVAEFVADGQPLPRVGSHWIACDSTGRPRVILRSVELRVGVFDDVDESFAYDEGEGARTLESWRDDHRRYWQRVSPALGFEWTEQHEIVFERFDVVWPEQPE